MKLTNDIRSNAMNLLEDVTKKTKEFHTDNYPMSIGEIISLYKDGEMIINPDFQRYFRWTIDQKSRFVESILLGIPIPSIFVYQREEDSIWELVDGLQRISTILEFVGELKDENGKLKPRLVLKGTKLLPSLKGVQWEKAENEDHNLPNPLRIDFKRAKMQVQIIKKESDKNAKFEVFDRLNTGGSFLSYQEVRNCLLIMLDKTLYIWLSELATNENFQNCISISDRLKEESYDMELVLKYLAISDINFEPKEFSKKEVNEYLTDYLTELCKSPSFDRDLEKRKFEKIFLLLSIATGDETFQKYSEDRFKGKFLDSAYEAITTGLKANIDAYSQTDTDIKILKNKIQSMWSENDFIDHIGTGSRARNRIPRMISFGKQHFGK
ncbi:DUF262 domain-containing protein [Aphanothece sacrum]|uniref:DUF262 domain-containing protein n=1 Tax=Aphanothece sacrum TaxID=1122 RepID=UPI001D13180F|nr:DUF262 domain-containing protein [Aphanothece sacrum]